MGPTLTGLAYKSTEDLLTSVLTPSAVVESGYRVLRLTLADGGWGNELEGILVDENPQRTIIRPLGREEQTISADRVASREILPGSLMPDGLLQSMQPEQVSALFAYLRTIE